MVDAEQTAQRRIVTLPLPDMSAFQGETAVLAFRLRNGGSETMALTTTIRGNDTDVPGSAVSLPGTPTLHATTGNYFVYVGGSVSASANQVPGLYEGSISVSVQY